MICPICREDRPPESFVSRRKSTRVGCKPCRKAQYHEDWYQEHKDLLRAERRAKYGTKGSHTPEQWQALLDKTGRRCLHCGCSDCELTEDHIQPLSKGGSDNIDNIQPLCERCNRLKGDKWEA